MCESGVKCLPKSTQTLMSQRETITPVAFEHGEYFHFGIQNYFTNLDGFNLENETKYTFKYIARRFASVQGV